MIRAILLSLFLFFTGVMTYTLAAGKVYALWDSAPNPDISRQNKRTKSRLWESSSYPIGNGYMGACLFGRTDRDWIQIADKTLSNAGKYGNGGITSFVDVYLDFNHMSPKNYRRTLHLNDAMFRVEYEHEGVEYYRECFASYPDNIMVVKLTANKKGSVSFKLEPEIPFLRDESDKYARSGEILVKDDLVTLSGTIPFFSCNYESQIKVLNHGGTLSGSANSITVSDADSVVILIAVGTNYELSSRVFLEHVNSKKLDANSFPHDQVTQRIKAAEKKGFEQLKSDHLADYQNLFSRTQVDFGSEVSPLPTKQLLAEYKKGKTDTYLEELMFNYGRYLLISSSRKGTLPSALQGVWTSYIETPWTGGYWHNINVQMNYWGACSANLSETFIPYIEYFQAYLAEAKTKATEYIEKKNNKALNGNENGWTIGTAASPYNIQSPGGHSGPGTVGFTTKLFWEYYDFTRDERFLKEIGYPALLGGSRFLSKTVKPSPDGLLLVNPSASPEQRHEGKFPDAVGTTFDQGFVWENHNDVLKAAAVLGIQNDELALFKDQMIKLDPIIIGASGQIKEYREENEYGDIGGKDHRHISHLCPLYPGTLINATTPEWLEAAKYSLDRRGTTRGGKGVTTGWALSHRMNLRARTKDGEKAHEVYKLLIQNRVLDNLWTLHPPFQIDANFGSMAGVSEMLLQSHEGYIAPLPALPKAWKTGQFQGLVARGNFVVSAKWADGRASSFKIVSRKGGQCIINYPGIAKAKLTNEKGVKIPFSWYNKDQITFSTRKGQEYLFKMR